MNKRFLLALVSVFAVAGLTASTAAAHHSEIRATIDCQGNVAFTAEAWNQPGASTAARTNNEVWVWASKDNGTSWAHIATGSFKSSNGFKFSGTYAAGTASTVQLKVQEKANWANGAAPGAPRYTTVTKSGSCSTTPTCPTMSGIVSSYTPIAIANGKAKVTFDIAAGCTNIELTLVSYKAPGPTFDENTADKQTVFEYKTQLFSAGAGHALEVAVPNCYYQVDFVYGKHIAKLGPAGSNNFYSKQGRLIDAKNGGTAACVEANPTPTPTPTPTPNPNPTPAPPVQQQAPVVQQAPIVQEQAPAPVPAPGVALVKTQRVGTTGSFVRDTVRAAAGKRIYYRMVATNTSAAPVTITLVDRICDAGTIAPADGQLVAAGASVTFTCSHRVTARDRSQIVNVAIATATASNGAQATATSSVVARVQSAVLGTQKTVKKKAVKPKVKQVKKKAKPAKPVEAAASFTG